MIKDTPFDERTLDITAGELPSAKPWGIAVCRTVLDLLDDQPWGRFTEMRPSVDDDWQPYVKAGAAKLVGPVKAVGFQRPGEPVFDGTLASGTNGNRAIVTIQAAAYDAGGGAAAVEGWLARALDAMPEPAEAGANADHDQMMFRRKRKVPTLLDPFSELGWLHVAYPAAYRENFARETLLSAPWHRVEERGDAIWMWSYEEPFHYDTPAAREAHAALRTYLGERMKL